MPDEFNRGMDVGIHTKLNNGTKRDISDTFFDSTCDEPLSIPRLEENVKEWDEEVHMWYGLVPTFASISALTNYIFSDPNVVYSISETATKYGMAGIAILAPFFAIAALVQRNKARHELYVAEHGEPEKISTPLPQYVPKPVFSLSIPKFAQEFATSSGSTVYLPAITAPQYFISNNRNAA